MLRVLDFWSSNNELLSFLFVFFFSSRRRHTRCGRDWSSDVCSSDLELGSIRALAGTAGNIVERYRYDSFGNLVQADPSTPPSAVENPFLFTGREWDAEIGRASCRERV